jgi:hypothetical protein
MVKMSIRRLERLKRTHSWLQWLHWFKKVVQYLTHPYVEIQLVGNDRSQFRTLTTSVVENDWRSTECRQSEQVNNTRRALGIRTQHYDADRESCLVNKVVTC